MSLWSALVDTGAKYLAVSGVSCCSNFRVARLVEKTSTFCVRWLEVVLPTPELPVARDSYEQWKSVRQWHINASAVEDITRIHNG